MWIYILVLFVFVIAVGLYWIIQPYLASRKTASNRNKEIITINYLDGDKKGI